MNNASGYGHATWEKTILYFPIWIQFEKQKEMHGAASCKVRNINLQFEGNELQRSTQFLSSCVPNRTEQGEKQSIEKRLKRRNPFRGNDLRTFGHLTHLDDFDNPLSSHTMAVNVVQCQQHLLNSVRGLNCGILS